MTYFDVPCLSHSYPYAAPLRTSARAPFRPFRAIRRVLATWQARIAERQALKVMPSYLLRDIGADAAWARHEAEKPVWRA